MTNGPSIVILGFLLCSYLVAGNPMPGPELEAERYETKLTQTMDELNSRESIGIFGNMISLERIAVEENEESQEADPLMRRVDEFLRSRKLQIRFPSDGSSADYFGRALGQKSLDFEFRALMHGASEARTKLKRVILPLLLALKLKAIIVLPIVITLIGLIGIKGLGAGILALLLSGAVALKALLTPPPSYPTRVSYAKPYDIHHDHWHRSQEELIQPYRAWSPEFSVDPQYGPYQDIP